MTSVADHGRRRQEVLVIIGLVDVALRFHL